MPTKSHSRSAMTCKSAGFSLLELLVSLTILLLVSSVVISGLRQMSYAQGTINNRSELHASVRSATELMQQEIGQAGRIAVPPGTSYTLAAAVPAANVGLSTTVAINSSSGSYPALWNPPNSTALPQLVVGTGSNQETVSVTAYNSSTHQITAVFNNATGQLSGAPVLIMGTFPSGVIPYADATNPGKVGGVAVTSTTGSTDTLLKIYGDINGDGNMVYIEYKCDTTAGKLYRNSMAYTAGSKAAVTNSMVLLPNILANPGNAACFSYQQQTVGADTYVLNVAVTLTVQTENKDPQTRQYQQETKALLNVSPRNVFEGWQLASAGLTPRIQPIPPTVDNLRSLASN
jgi:prepilin-type N-terminal cleavage/methylation domain-containing protein